MRLCIPGVSLESDSCTSKVPTPREVVATTAVLMTFSTMSVPAPVDPPAVERATYQAQWIFTGDV